MVDGAGICAVGELRASVRRAIRPGKSGKIGHSGARKGMTNAAIARDGHGMKTAPQRIIT
jgi:hypothetical protein